MGAKRCISLSVFKTVNFQLRSSLAQSPVLSVSVTRPIMRPRTGAGNNCLDAQAAAAALCPKSKGLRCTEPAIKKDDRKKGEIRKIETDGEKQREILDVRWMMDGCMHG